MQKEKESSPYQSRAELFVGECFEDDPGRIKAALSSVTVVIGIPKSLAKTRLGQIGLVTATNIVARLGALVPSLFFDVPVDVKVLDGIPLLKSGQSLLESLVGLTRSLAQVQPSVKERCIANKKTRYDYGLFIGKVTLGARQSVTIGANRWLASIRTDGRSERIDVSDKNPLGIALAAAIGSSELVKRMWMELPNTSAKIETIGDRVVVSAFDFTVNPKHPTNPVMRGPCELNHVVLLGCGAIGSAALFTLSCLPDLRMSLDLVDMDFIEPSNEERLFTSSSPKEDLGKLKVVHAQKFMQRSQHDVNTFIYPMAYEKYVDDSRVRLGYLWVALDSAEARRGLQSELASVMCNGATDGGRWMVSMHEYANPENCCLIDLYSQSDAERFDPVLELSKWSGLNLEEIHNWSHTGGLLGHDIITRAASRQADLSKRRAIYALTGLTYPQVLAGLCSTMRPSPNAPAATISFVSLAPAIALVSDCVKRCLYNWRPKASEPNMVLFDMLGHPNRSRRMRVRAESGCMCQSKLYREAFTTRQNMRRPYLNKMFRSASLASLPEGPKQEMAQRKIRFAHYYK